MAMAGATTQRTPAVLARGAIRATACSRSSRRQLGARRPPHRHMLTDALQGLQVQGTSV